MPPWLADAKFGHFKNDRRVSEAERQTVAAWAQAGAPEGDSKDARPGPRFTEGWNIGKPAFPHRESCRTNTSRSSNFKEDVWIEVGDQTWEEMMMGWLDYSLPVSHLSQRQEPPTPYTVTMEQNCGAS